MLRILFGISIFKCLYMLFKVCWISSNLDSSNYKGLISPRILSSNSLLLFDLLSIFSMIFLHTTVKITGLNSSLGNTPSFSHLLYNSSAFLYIYSSESKFDFFYFESSFCSSKLKISVWLKL